MGTAPPPPPPEGAESCAGYKTELSSACERLPGAKTSAGRSTMITPLRPTNSRRLRASPASSPPSTILASHRIQRDDLPAPPSPGGDGGPDAPLHLPGEQHRRQRPRLAPPGDPRFQRRHRRRPTRSTLISRVRGSKRSRPPRPCPRSPHAGVIDGTSQPGYAGTPLIELSGGQAGTANGLTVTGPDVTIRGLDINSFSQAAGILISGAGRPATRSKPTTSAPIRPARRLCPIDFGIQILGGASDNACGRDVPRPPAT